MTYVILKLSLLNPPFVYLYQSSITEGFEVGSATI